jgi:hypothetical protein
MSRGSQSWGTCEVGMRRIADDEARIWCRNDAFRSVSRTSRADLVIDWVGTSRPRGAGAAALATGRA